METNQRLVDYRNISAPWTVNDKNAVVSKYEGFIVPRSFRFFDKKLTPIEFEFSSFFPQGNCDLEFFERLSCLLHDHNLENVLGVRCLDKFDPELSVEVTEGKTNIMISRGSVQNSELIEAFWIFSTDDDQRCHCRESCWKDSEGKHIEDHGCS